MDVQVYILLSCCCFLANQETAYGKKLIFEKHRMDDLADIKAIVDRLFTKVRDMQQKQTTPSNPPFTYGKQKGLYESDVKLYFHGSLQFYLLRQTFGIFDNNMFASSWITTAILEAFKYGNAPKPDDEQLMMTVDAMSRYENKNTHFSNSIRTFWPQIYNNTLKVWQSTPQNLLDFFKTTYKINWDLVFKILKFLGQDELVRMMQFLIDARGAFLKAFMIPPDFDDTFVNLGVGTLLMELSSEFPEVFSRWKSQNSNIKSAFDALKKYAYRPMSNDSRVNSLDPRSYYCFRGFLEEAKRTGNDVALIPTWVQDTHEVRKGFYEGVDMPFNINNVDVTVAANAIYGITSSVLSGLVPLSVLDDADIQKIYLNTSSLIAYSIRTHFIERKDLALLYYPSEMEFYWFVARTYNQLQDYLKKGPLHHALEQVRKLFRNVLRSHVTEFLLKNAKSDSGTTVYYDDFLGDGDYDRHNNTVVRAEDRIFTTAMAVNAFLTTWTTYDEAKRQLLWDFDTPYVVIEVTTKAVHWLTEHVLGCRYKPWNAFFSGSVKGQTSLPMEYPANRFEYLNGTIIKDLKYFIKHYDMASIVAMQGIPSEAWYKNTIQHNPFGIHTPTVFPGYNVRDTLFPFWSSEPYTYAVSMLALAKFNNAVLP